MKDWTGNSKSTYTMLGASNHSDHEREDNDFYATDPKALELLLDLEEFDPYVWEPACGKGHLSEVLKKRGYIVRSTDLIDRGYLPLHNRSDPAERTRARDDSGGTAILWQRHRRAYSLRAAADGQSARTYPAPLR